MELTQTHFERIAHLLFPKQRGNVAGRTRAAEAS